PDLTVVSPHNNAIRGEFARAFSAWHEEHYGSPVTIEWVDVGGSSDILKYLRNVYAGAETAEIDVVFGGGVPNFKTFADEGFIRPVDLPEGYTANVPQTFGGLEMYDVDGMWAGVVVSGFAFLYNRTILQQMGLPAPRTWDDLGDDGYHGQVALADPAHSGSILAVYEMIAQSGRDWPDGWTKLLLVLGNASRFYPGASLAADAVKTETAVAACIDFYGAMRVNQLPQQLTYVNPPGQTAYTPDPVAVLRDPPHPELAERFVEFLLSPQGQALWALPVGVEGGPRADALFRTPIRKDVFERRGGQMLEGIASPYAAGDAMQLDPTLHAVIQEPLKHLIGAAAVKNLDGLQVAREAIARAPDETARRELLAAYGRLPDDVDSADDLAELARRLSDATQRERITTAWERFFEAKYARMTR
ncbi:MAG: ABC transporter substrate-binding protein, partial [Planctomycetota bacterium]